MQTATVVYQKPQDTLESRTIKPQIVVPAASPMPKTPCRIIRPYQVNPAFSGREAELKTISEVLSPPNKLERAQSKLALLGLGGMGKTQIALSYAFKSFSAFPVILWAHADNRTKLSQSFAEFAYELGLVQSVTENQATCRDVLKRGLEFAGRCYQ